MCVSVWFSYEPKSKLCEALATEKCPAAVRNMLSEVGSQADQTPDHVLQSCPVCTERRQLTWPKGVDLATKLWGLAEDLYQTAGFVASTGLKI